MKENKIEIDVGNVDGSCSTNVIKPSMTNVIILNFLICEKVDSQPLDDLIDRLVQQGACVAFKCSLDDHLYQNAKQLSDYKLFHWSTEEIKTKKDQYGHIIVDTEYNPGHSHQPNGIWFGSCHRIWFGKEYC